MVHTKSERKLKDSIEQAHGKIVAACFKYDRLVYLHDNGSVTTVSDIDCVEYIVNHKYASLPWLSCQVLLAKDILPGDFHDHFNLKRIDHGYLVFEAKDLSCHSRFDVYLLEPEKLGVDCEII